MMRKKKGAGLVRKLYVRYYEVVEGNNLGEQLLFLNRVLKSRF